MNDKSETLAGKKAKTNPGGQPVSPIVNKIDVRPFHRQEQDIQKWRAATESAEARWPRRSQLYDLYADVDLDDQVHTVKQKRIDASFYLVSSCENHVLNNSISQDQFPLEIIVCSHYNPYHQTAVFDFLHPGQNW